MPLTKQIVDIPLTNGVNSKIDDKNTLGSTLLSLENRVFNKLGSLNKRFGYSTITNKDIDGNSLTNLKGIFTYREDQLVLIADNKLYSYSETNDRWVEKDTFVSASSSIEDIIRNTSEQSNVDSAAINGIIVYAWEDTRGGVRYSVQDETSKSFLVSDSILDASGDTPRCVAINNTVAIFYGNGTDLNYKIINVGSPTSFTKTGTARSDLDSGHIFDLTVIGNTIYCFYKRSTAGQAVLAYFNNLAVLQNQIVLTETIDDAVAIYQYLDSGNTDNYLNLVWKEDADTIKAKIHQRFLAEQVATVTIENTVGLDVEKITATRTNNTTDQITIFYHVPNASSNSDDYIRSNTLALNGTVGTAGVFARSVGICSKAFNDSDGNLYIGTLHESSLQSTVFVLDSNADVLCKYSPGFAGSHSNLKQPSSTYTQDNGDIAFTFNTKGRIISENGTLFTLEGISKASINFDSLDTYNNVSLNDNLLIAGGILSNYDGQSIHEQGFHLYPEGVTNSGNSTSGGSMSDGNYQYSVVYEWTDNVGNLHRSAPSVALPVTVSGGGNTQTVDLNIPTLRLTKKTSPRSEVSIAVYRTEAAGSIFYRVSSITNPTLNDKTIDSITFTDTASDNSIISNEILYTTGGVLDNISAPSCDIVTAHNNRMFIAGLPEKNKIRYSKSIVSGEGLGFNEGLQIALEPRGGNITQMASMDSNLIIFKKDNMYVVSGEGPNNTGAGNTFNEPELIASDVGCQDSNSVVLGPNGLYFKAKKGIYLLDRSLSTTYIGAPVEDFNTETITSSQLLADVNEIRFTTNTGTTLVYNYYFNQWSTFTNQKTTDSVIWQNNYIFIDTNNKIFQESNGYLDNSTFVTSKVSTGWITVNSIQGFQRAYRLSVLGEFKSDHKLKLKIYTDYSAKVQQEHVFNVGDLLSVNDNFYGDEIYGNQTYYGGNVSEMYQFQLHLTQQKCQVMRVEIEDVFDNSQLGNNTGEGMVLSGLAVQVGVKRGLNKVQTLRKG